MPDFGGAPVAQNIKAPDFTQTLSGLMGLQQQKQQLQVGANEAQKATQTMQERQGVTQMMKSGVDDQGNSIRAADGTPDVSKILPALGRMAPLTGQQYAQNILQTHNARVGLETAATALTGQQRAALMGPIQSIAANPGDPDAVKKASGALDEWASAHPEMGGIVNSAKLLLGHVQSTQDPAQRAQMASHLSALFQPGQAVQTQPQGASVSNGQQTLIGATAPPVAGGAFTPATGVQQQPSPTTTVVDRSTGQPSLYGARAPLTPTSAPVTTGTAPGVAEGITGPVAANNAHFSGVQQDAVGAPNRIAALQTIKEQIPAAQMGKGDVGDFLRRITKVFGGAADANTAQDIMAKNLSVLAAQGGNTDAARALGEMANPSYHMTPQAAKAASEQLIGIEAKKQAAGAFFAGTPTNSPEYTQKMTRWNQVADPRAFEYAAKSPEDRAAMKAELVKAGTWSGLADKMRALHAMGVDPQ